MSDIRNFPDHSFLRVFHAPRGLSDEEIGQIETALKGFLGAWASHEQPVAGAYEIVDERFIVIAADEGAAPISGCSKDSLVGVIRELGSGLGIDFVHGPPLCYEKDGAVHSVSRDEFAKLVESKEVVADTPVFDLTIASVGPFKAGRFKVRAGDCWHARAYDLATS